MEKLKFYLLCSVSLICVFVFGALIYAAVSDTPEIKTASAAPQNIVIIDAGHGGEDGGAVDNGILEKNINLSIAQKLEDMLTAAGCTVIMTRDSDIAIYDSDSSTIREKKVSDMHNRLDIANSSPNNILLSIHQNKFTQPQYSGTQVFYSKNNPKSAVLAESLRKSITGLLQPENKRELKAADSSVFILNNAEVPAVIIECGFLSNQEEAQKLNDEKYQTEMAFAIMCGYLDYLKSAA